MAGGDAQGAADHAGSIFHDLQAHAVIVGQLFAEADAIVGNSEFSFGSVPREHDVDLIGFAMLQSIVDGFLGDAVEMSGDGIVRNEDRLRAVKNAIHVEKTGDGLG